MKKHIVIDGRESGTTTGRYVDKLLEYLNQLNPNYKITVLTTPKRIEFVRGIAPRFIVKPTRFKEFSFGEQLGFLQQIRSLQADLVFFAMIQQPILYRKKVVTAVQDLTTARFHNPNKNWLIATIKRQVYKIVIKIVAKKSVSIITPSEYSKNDLARFARINSRKINVIYDAADKIPDKPEPIDELIDKKFLMYVGRPFPHKNLEGLIKAFVVLGQTNPELRLVLAGKKDAFYKKIERDVKNRQYKNIVFTDFVSEGQLRWLYENTAAYVFPSFSEGFGLPGLEAMIHGAPVASSNATCLPEVYKDAALYFDPNSTDGIVDALNQMLSDQKLRQRLIKRGHEVAKQYSWKRMAEQTLDIFKEALDD